METTGTYVLGPALDGFLTHSVYAAAALILLVFFIKAGVFPALYIGVFKLILVILGVLFRFMHRRKTASIIADVLCTLLSVMCVAGSFETNS